VASSLTYATSSKPSPLPTESRTGPGGDSTIAEEAAARGLWLAAGLPLNRPPDLEAPRAIDL
jgi:hypothetical protein